MAWHELFAVDANALTPDQLSEYLRAVNLRNGSAQTARAKVKKESQAIKTGVAPTASLSLSAFLKKP